MLTARVVFEASRPRTGDCARPAEVCAQNPRPAFRGHGRGLVNERLLLDSSDFPS